MNASFRSLTRGSVVTLAALSFVACSDAIAPLDLTPEDLEWAGHNMVLEIETGVAKLFAPGAMNMDYWVGLYAKERSPAENGGTLAFSEQQVAGHPSFPVIDAACGVFSQSPPADGDADGVPDNLTITFAVPACRFPTETGSRDLTGVVRISDPLPGVAAPAFNMTVDDLGITVVDPDLNGSVRRNGMLAVSASASGLSQTMSWLETSRYDGHPTLGLHMDWSATFAAAQGSTITPGEALPNGAYALNGSLGVSQDLRSAQFTITTVEPLQYSTECAVAKAEGLAWTSFTAGRVRIALRHNPDMGFAEITYTDCGATVVLISG